MTDRFVVGYSKNDDNSVLVVLRPVDPEHSMEYEDVCSYEGELADIIYQFLSGIDCISHIEVDNPNIVE